MSYYEHDDAIRSMLRRARLLKVDDTGTQQLVDLMNLAGDQPKKVFRPQDHGLSSNPPVNSEGWVLALGGRSDRLLYVDGGHKDHRPKNLPTGGTALYDADGKLWKMVKDATTYDAGNKPLTISNATVITIQGSSSVAVGLGGIWVRIAGGKVHLGVSTATEDAIPAVMTDAGASTKVFAKV
jgi:phage gp45-like